MKIIILIFLFFLNNDNVNIKTKECEIINAVITRLKAEFKSDNVIFLQGINNNLSLDDTKIIRELTTQNNSITTSDSSSINFIRFLISDCVSSSLVLTDKRRINKILGKNIELYNQFIKRWGLQCID